MDKIFDQIESLFHHYCRDPSLTCYLKLLQLQKPKDLIVKSRLIALYLK